MPRIVNTIRIILFDPVRSYEKLIAGVPRAMPAPTILKFNGLVVDINQVFSA